MVKEEVEEEEPLSPMARLLESPGINCCIVTKIGFKCKINPNTILDDLKHNVSKHPRFSRKLSENSARWIKTEINVEDHVFVPDINTEEGNEEGESFVNDYLSRLTMIPLDKSRPLWEIHILNVQTCDAEAVGVMRCHHSLGDGMSLMSLLVACTRKASDPEAFPTIPAIKRRAKFGLSSKGWFMRLIFSTFNSTRLIWNTVVDLVLLLATVLFLKDTKTPLKYTVDIKNNPKRFYHRILSLDDIKLIKNTLNVTINDVLHGVTQAALSGYLNRRYGNANAEGGTSALNLNNLPGRIRLRAGVAVNLRQKIGIQPLADMLAKGSKCRWGNYNTMAYIPFSISIETDPLVHLFKAKSIMDRSKHSHLAIVLYSVIDFIFKVLGPKVGAVLFKRPVSNTTTFISNIVGPIEEVSLHGNHIAYIALSGYGHSQALLIHFLSYAEKMIVMIAVDPIVIPDPHTLCNEMEQSLKNMKLAVTGDSGAVVGSHN